MPAVGRLLVGSLTMSGVETSTGRLAGSLAGSSSSTAADSRCSGRFQVPSVAPMAFIEPWVTYSLPSWKASELVSWSLIDRGRLMMTSW